MKSRPVRPFLQAEDDLLEPLAWKIHLTDGEWIDAQEVVKGWDINTDVSLQSLVRVDLDAVRESCGLSADCTVEMIASWHASGTGRRVVGDRQQLSYAPEVALAMTIPGREAGGKLTLTRHLVLRSGSAESQLAAKRPGSVLWTELEPTRLVLEADAARFPIEMVDFVEAGFSPEAVWRVKLDMSDMNALALASMRVQLNAAHPAAEALRLETDKPNQVGQSTLYWDVARQMILRAVVDDDFVDEAGTFDDESIGRALEDTIQRVLGSSPAEARALYRQRPDRFEEQIQAATNLMSGVR